MEVEVAVVVIVPGDDGDSLCSGLGSAATNKGVGQSVRPALGAIPIS